MKLTKITAPTLVALGVMSALQGVHAAPVYEILNLDELYDIKGTLDGTRNGYGLAVNANDTAVNISKGRKKLLIEDGSGHCHLQ